ERAPAATSRARTATQLRRPTHDLSALRAAQHGFREGVDAYVAREKAIEHRAEQERTFALERRLVEVQRDFEAAREARRTGQRQAPDHGRALHRANAVDLLARAGAELGVELEHFTQRRGAQAVRLVRERELIQREMAHEPPRGVAPRRRLARLG